MRKKALINENIKLKELNDRLQLHLKAEADALFEACNRISTLKEELDSVKKADLSELEFKLRTSLNEIIGIANLMKETELNDKQKEYLEFIIAAGYKMLDTFKEYKK